MAKEFNSNLAKLRYEPIIPVSEDELEADYAKYYPPGLDLPKRPSWKKSMKKEDLDFVENKSFRMFCEGIDKTFNNSELSLYELNLETWRQLWRVTEMSDILLIIVDARFAVSIIIFS